MRQVIIRRGQVSLDEVPAPLIAEKHVLVEVAYSLISTGTEVASLEQSEKPIILEALEHPEKVKKLIDHLRRNGIRKTIGRVQEKSGSGTELGYSCAGLVLQVGAGITEIQPGDRVACAGARLANHAELVLVPHNLVVKVPDNCVLRDASSVTIGAITMQGFRRTDPRLGEVVAVIGLGLLGQITVQLLKVGGCQVIGLDLDARRVALAISAGADQAYVSSEVDVLNEIRHFTSDHGVDATIITAASTSDAIVQQAMEITRKKGRVVVVGAVGLGLKRSPFYEKEIDFLISSSYGPGRYDPRYETQALDYPFAYVRWTENRNMKEYLHLITEKKIQLGSILEREYDLRDAPQAYEELRNGTQKPLGILLRYPTREQKALAEKQSTKVTLRTGTTSGKIEVAVIGAGSFARSMHLPNLQSLPDLYHIRAIVERNGAQAKFTADQFGADYACSQVEDALADPDINMVIITTRHDSHAELACKAAQAGKAILLEKPMALNLPELENLETVLRETGVPFLMGFNRRFSPAAQRLYEIAKERQNPLMMLYRVNAGYLPPENWTQTSEGGGRIIGEACHMLDLFKYFVGQPRAIDVACTSMDSASEHLQAGDNKVITIRYEDGSVGNLLYTALGAPCFPKEYVEVYSDGKTLVINDFRDLSIYGSKSKGWKSAVQDKGHLKELQVFADYVIERSEPPISLDSMVEVTKISIAAAGNWENPSTQEV